MLYSTHNIQYMILYCTPHTIQYILHYFLCFGINVIYSSFFMFHCINYVEFILVLFYIQLCSSSFSLLMFRLFLTQFPTYLTKLIINCICNFNIISNFLIMSIDNTMNVLIFFWLTNNYSCIVFHSFFRE